MNSKTFFLISDIHGCLTEFKKILSHWNPHKDVLVLMGDYIDKGEYSLETVRYIMYLKETYNEQVIVLKGNHEQMLLDFLEEEETTRCFQEFYNHTMVSFYGQNAKKCKNSSRRQKREHVLYCYKKELRFLKQLPYFHEEESMIFVHAGINLFLDDWKKGNLQEMLWVREMFYKSSTKALKRIFFGHTSVQNLHRRPQKNTTVWESPLKDKVGIDGGCVSGYSLLGVRVNELGEILKIYEIKKE